MSQQVEIQAAAYRIVLTADSLDVFHAASRSDHVKGKDGEALVDALLVAAKGGIARVERYKDGHLNDGAHGEPAYQGFNGDGALIYAERYKDGKHNDGPNGEPAIQQFNDAGGLFYAARYKDGNLNDGANGEPAIRQFNDAGALIRAARYKDGKFVKELDAPEIAAYLDSLTKERTIQSIRSACPALTIL